MVYYNCQGIYYVNSYISTSLYYGIFACELMYIITSTVVMYESMYA